MINLILVYLLKIIEKKKKIKRKRKIIKYQMIKIRTWQLMMKNHWRENYMMQSIIKVKKKV